MLHFLVPYFEVCSAMYVGFFLVVIFRDYNRQPKLNNLMYSLGCRFIIPKFGLGGVIGDLSRGVIVNAMFQCLSVSGGRPKCWYKCYLVIFLNPESVKFNQ